MKKIPVNMRLSDDVVQYLERLRHEDAVNKTAYIEKLVRSDMQLNKKTVRAMPESNRLSVSQ